MIIAVACINDDVVEKFEDFEQIIIFETDGQNIMTSEDFEKADIKSDDISTFMKEQKISLILTGFMSEENLKVYEDLKIQVLTDAKGNSFAIVDKYLQGKKVLCEGSCNCTHH